MAGRRAPTAAEAARRQRALVNAAIVRAASDAAVAGEAGSAAAAAAEAANAAAAEIESKLVTVNDRLAALENA